MTFNDLHHMIVADAEVVPDRGYSWLLLQSHAVAANTHTHIETEMLAMTTWHAVRHSVSAAGYDDVKRYET